MVLSPLAGFTIAFLFMVALLWLVRRMRPAAVQRGSRRLQLVSACAMAFSHGSNDAQKSMGVIAALLVATHETSSLVVPLWVKVATGLAVTLGTALGGWRIVKTVGRRIYSMKPQLLTESVTEIDSIDRSLPTMKLSVTGEWC